MNHQHLYRAFPIVASALGRRFGVTVAVGGDQAFTDGKMIVLPAGAMEEDPDIVWGYLAHEAGHVRYTDFETFGLVKDQIQWAILNTLEDVRVEKEMAMHYPGTVRTIAKVLASMKAKGELVVKKDVSPPAALVAFIFFKLRKEVLDNDLGKEAEEAEGVIRQYFPPSIVDGVKEILKKAPGQSTQEALEITNQIINFVAEAARRGDDGSDDGSQAEQDGADSPSSQDSDSNSPSQQDGEYIGDNPVPSCPSSTDGTDRWIGDHGSQAETDRWIGDPRQQEKDFLDPFRKIKEQLEGSRVDSGRWILPVEKVLAGGPDPDLVAEVRLKSVRLRAALQSFVQANRMVKRWRSKTGRLLDSRHLAGIAMDGRVFQRAAERPAPNADIFLLIDRSSSMIGRIEHAGKAAMAFAMAIEEIPGVSLAVSAFPGEENNEILTLLQYGHRVSRAASNFRLSASGDTPMAEAIWHAASKLIGQENKIVIVITDGDPDDTLATAEIIRMCYSAGIKVWGIGIDVDVSHLFPIASTIRTVEELAEKMFELGRKILV